MSDVIQALWIGDSLGPLQLLSMSSFLQAGHVYHLYCYDKIANVPPGIVMCDANEILPESAIFKQQVGRGRGSLAVFADVFRYKLLHQKGGWWVDADVVCLKRFDFPEPIVWAGAYDKRSAVPKVSNAVMKVPPGNVEVKSCYEQCIEQDPAALDYGALGPKLLTRFVSRSESVRYAKKPVVFCPIPYWNWEWLLDPDPSRCAGLITAETYAVHLIHEAWRRKGIHRRVAFPCTSMIGRFLRDFQVNRLLEGAA